MSTLFGIDALLAQSSEHRHLRFALATNDAARTARDTSLHSRTALLRENLNIVRLFSGEHGIAAAAPDGAPVPDGQDPFTKLPVISLYGQTHSPPPGSLDDIDVLLFDIPDVGARFYTYIWTLSYLMEACAKSGKPLWVLDRPNPIGGELSSAEGPALEEENFSTFVGRWNIPVRYSLTIGELAQLWKTQRNLDLDLRIFKCEGWQRAMHWPDTGLSFIPTSPAMVSYATALLYPGTCLIEGTNLSEARGTIAPFRTFGAPWLDAHSITDSINMLRLPGLGARPITFIPSLSKFKSEKCQGIRLEVTDARALRPVSAMLQILPLILQRHPIELKFHDGHFDRLVGNNTVRAAMLNDDLNSNEWTPTPDWPGQCEAAILYP